MNDGWSGCDRPRHLSRSGIVSLAGTKPPDRLLIRQPSVPSVSIRAQNRLLGPMASDRLTVSLDERSRTALDDLVSRTGRGQSELVRQAIVFYATNFQVASADSSADVEQYHELLSDGEHVILDIDFLHGLLDHIEVDAEDPHPEFQQVIDRVAEYHATEYRARFDTLEEVLDWLALCGFLTSRKADENTYHVMFPTEKIKWFMTQFIRKSTSEHDFDISVSEGVSKVLITEIR